MGQLKSLHIAKALAVFDAKDERFNEAFVWCMANGQLQTAWARACCRILVRSMINTVEEPKAGSWLEAHWRHVFQTRAEEQNFPKCQVAFASYTHTAQQFSLCDTNVCDIFIVTHPFYTVVPVTHSFVVHNVKCAVLWCLQYWQLQLCSLHFV